MNLSQELMQIRIDEAEAFVSDLISLKLKFPSLIFRGISNDRERYPSLMRVNKDGNPINCVQKEHVMLENFYQKAAHLISGSGDALHFVTCAQHYGIPTRLIDWSDDPLVALFFAVSGYNPDSEGYRLLVCDSSEQFELNQIYYRTTWNETSIPSSAHQIDQFFGFCDCIKSDEGINMIAKRANIEPCNGFILLRPGFSNERIRAQKGLFVIPKSNSKPKLDKEYKEAGVAELQIPVCLRGSLRKCLSVLGISPDLLFGDLASIARMIKDEALT